MLRSEIYELERAVDSILFKERIDGDTHYHKEVAGQVSYVQSVCSDLKKKWTNELLSSAKDQVIKRYVQYHQAGIIQLSDKVSREVPALNFSEDNIASIKAINQGILGHLENLLEFLRSNFYQFFDIDHKSSIYHCEILNQKIAVVEPRLRLYQSDSEVQSLINCILESVHEILADGLASGISYRQADHCLHLIQMTHQLLSIGSETAPKTLFLALYQQNMNSLYFFNWYQTFLSEQIAKMADKKCKEEFINNELKGLVNIYVSADKSIQPELPSTDVYLIPWLQEQVNRQSQRTVNNKFSMQMPLNLSVPQFALFVRIFYKTGCFPTENVAMITRFFTDHFTTKKQSHISRKSFSRAFYNLDQSAAAVVRDFLQKMLNYLNKTYFP
ncbi:hypothetical protein ABIC45_002929 [Mucilaginibacter rubeus]|uniref:hypothetical protein n=1 Tax=Mucilaginibacter rubeus TaxID=2027860 RepID=UPI0033947588